MVYRQFFVKTATVCCCQCLLSLHYTLLYIASLSNLRTASRYPELHKQSIESVRTTLAPPMGTLGYLTASRDEKEAKEGEACAVK